MRVIALHCKVLDRKPFYLKITKNFCPQFFNFPVAIAGQLTRTDLLSGIVISICYSPATKNKTLDMRCITRSQCVAADV